MPTLTEFLSGRATVAFHGGDSPQAAAARQLAVDHLTNIHRATTDGLDPEAVELWRRETADVLDALPLTATQVGELTELFEALETDADQDWAQDVLTALGLGDEQGVTPMVVSGLVHIHRTSRAPDDASWSPPRGPRWPS